MDRDKVVKGLECCRNIDENCEKCPYNYEGEYGENECLIGQLMSDILELLKEQPDIVHCKDCTYRGEINCPQYYRRAELLDNYYCADGERKEGR